MDAAAAAFVDCHWRRHYLPVSATTNFSAPTWRRGITQGV